ncbi:MAG: hypothetical protein CSB47_10350 [Proteobacteria bacterium]|nr:MAG: hypothetical protein CSB47_10350 [Pseudomonadota bacterium]
MITSLSDGSVKYVSEINPEIKFTEDIKQAMSLSWVQSEFVSICITVNHRFERIPALDNTPSDFSFGDLLENIKKGVLHDPDR